MRGVVTTRDAGSNDIEARIRERGWPCRRPPGPTGAGGSSHATRVCVRLLIDFLAEHIRKD